MPCCHKCNNKKGEAWRINGLRRFIHFYYDTFLNNKFLHANLNFNAGPDTPTIQYFLLQSASMNNRDFELVASHFEDLDLLNEYRARAKAFVSSEIDVMRDGISNGISIQMIQSNLMSRYNSRRVRFGINYWETAMYEALFNNNTLNTLLS